jgi:hypothetical protein
MSAMDAYYGLSTHKWQLYQCSDCDPEFADDEPEYTEPYRIICQKGAAVPDDCPRCGSHLSLLDSVEVVVSKAPR